MSAQLYALDPRQQAVADARDGPLLVLAGAGTGKTRALLARAAALVERGTSARRILLLTFTQKAAREMVERLAIVAPEAATQIWVGTFHAIAVRILRTYSQQLNYGPDFGILGRNEARELLEEVMATQFEAGPAGLPDPGRIAQIHSMTVNSDRTLDSVLRERNLTGIDPEAYEAICLEYLVRKIELNVMDYDDLLANWLVLMIEHPEVLQSIAESFDHVLVDEYQDVNPLQSRILDLLCEGHRNLTAVGDPCQAIYGFRGADVQQIRGFGDRYPEMSVISLRQNYRSSPAILALANGCAQRLGTTEFEALLPSDLEGPKPVAVGVANAEEEARFIAQRIQELADEGVHLGEQAVLYRTHAQARALEFELQRRGIPHALRSGVRFFESNPIRDAMAHLRIAIVPTDIRAWSRALEVWPGVGKVIVQRLLAHLFEDGDPWERLSSQGHVSMLDPAARRALEGLRDPLLSIYDRLVAGRPDQAIAVLVETRLGEVLGGRHPEDLADRLEDLKILAGICLDGWDEGRLLDNLLLSGHVTRSDEQSKVRLSTVHQAKGLEWEVVFITGLIDGVFPLRPMAASDAQLAEERRLFYVAITRAKRRLYLCHPANTAGSDLAAVNWPSRFLTELEDVGADLMDHWVIEGR